MEAPGDCDYEMSPYFVEFPSASRVRMRGADEADTGPDTGARSSYRGVGRGDLEMVTLQHPSGASAIVYLWGATLTSYRTATGVENIFVSPGALFDGKKAIRGGVPVVFPQFGQPSKAMPQHGFARCARAEPIALWPQHALSALKRFVPMTDGAHPSPFSAPARGLSTRSPTRVKSLASCSRSQTARPPSHSGLSHIVLSMLSR
jgi:hypothetical protein